MCAVWTIDRVVQVLLHMLTDRRAHDSTACMAAILSMGRHGAWPLAEQLLLAAFGPRYGLERISGMQPAALAQVPESFQEVRHSPWLTCQYRLPDCPLQCPVHCFIAHCFIARTLLTRLQCVPVSQETGYVITV